MDCIPHETSWVVGTAVDYVLRYIVSIKYGSNAAVLIFVRPGFQQLFELSLDDMCGFCAITSSGHVISDVTNRFCPATFL